MAIIKPILLFSKTSWPAVGPTDGSLPGVKQQEGEVDLSPR